MSISIFDLIRLKARDLVYRAREVNTVLNSAVSKIDSCCTGAKGLASYFRQGRLAYVPYVKLKKKKLQLLTLSNTYSETYVVNQERISEDPGGRKIYKPSCYLAMYVETTR